MSESIAAPAPALSDAEAAIEILTELLDRFEVKHRLGKRTLAQLLISRGVRLDARLLAQQPAAQAPAEALAEEIAALTAEYNTLPIVDNGLWYPLGNLIELLEKQASVARGVELWRGDVAKRRAALTAAEAGEAGS